MRARPLLVGLFAFNLLILGGVVLIVLRTQRGLRREQDHQALTTTLPLADFQLQDCHGHAVSADSYRGKVVLVYFGYSYCPDVCPTALGYQGRLLKALGEQAQQVVPLFITIDPSRDTPAHLAAYVALFDQRIVGLTGSEEQIRHAAQEFGAWYQRASPDGRRMPTSGSASAPALTAAPLVVAPTPGFYLMDHSSSTYLVDRSGHLQGTIDAEGNMDAAVAAVRACF